MNHAIVLGPVPDSSGGIGVLMGYLSRTTARGTSLRFVDSGGSPGPVPVRLAKFARALATCLGPVPENTVFHLNQSSRTSTWRKLVLTYALRLRKRTYVLHIHGGKFDTFLDGLHPLAGRLVSDMLTNAAGVIVLGEYWKNYISEAAHVPRESFYVLPNAVPGPDSVPEDRETPVVLFSGQLTRRKGVVELLQAWAKIPQNLRSHLVLAGDLNDPDGDISRLLEVTPDIETTGWIGPDEIAERLAQASVLVLPSYGENLPMSLLDGMAWGLAPVVTDVGAVGEVIQDGKNGWIVPTGDPETLAHVLETLLLDPERRMMLGRAARRRWAENYRIDKYREQLDRVYADVLNDQR